MTRVLIVNDHRLFADAMQFALEAQGMEVVKVVTTAAEARVAARTTKPDLVLMDPALLGSDDVGLARDLVRETPELKLLALTSVENPAAGAQAMRAGFHGYVTNVTPLAELEPMLRTVLAGQIVLPQQPANTSAVRPQSRPTPAELLAAQLTARERDVLELLVGGIGGPEIASRLSISPNTVRTHVQSILTKLGVHSRLEAVAFAIRNKVVEAPASDGQAVAG